jgi:hypothetical protein
MSRSTDCNWLQNPQGTAIEAKCCQLLSWLTLHQKWNFELKHHFNGKIVSVIALNLKKKFSFSNTKQERFAVSEAYDLVIKIWIFCTQILNIYKQDKSPFGKKLLCDICFLNLR